MTNSPKTPVEIDEALAARYEELARIDQRSDSRAASLIREAGAEYRYVGRRRVPNLSVAEAVSRIRERLANPTDEHQLGLANGFYLRVDAKRDLDDYEALLGERAAKLAEIDALDALYTGWSRFFVVTSSNGHIHRSMNCPTCRPTTTFGWLPSLSGKSEPEAIEFFGPAAECLCSVCFPDAPVAKDRNLSEAEVASILAGETPESPADRKARIAAEREAKKAEKAERAAARAAKTRAKVDAVYAKHPEILAPGYETRSLYDLDLPATVEDMIRDDLAAAR